MPGPSRHGQRLIRRTSILQCIHAEVGARSFSRKGSSLSYRPATT